MTQLATSTHDTPGSGTGSENYVRNLCALWESDPKLAMAIEAVHPGDVPALEKAREGGWTVRVLAEGGASVYLHSRYRPRAEAETWVAGLGSDDRYAVVVSGFGLGYHVRALWERLGGAEGDAVVVIAEPRVELLKAALGAEDYSDLLGPAAGGGAARAMIFTALDRGVLVERLEPWSVRFLCSESGEDEFGGMKFAVHEASARVSPGFHRGFHELMKQFVAYIRTGFITMRENAVTTCRNIANNIGRYATTPPIDAMRDAFRGVPAILVAAGPSLAKNMHLLHEVVGESKGGQRMKGGRRAVIIAVQTMLKPLLAAGIEPDFVTSLDYNTVSTRFFENLEESGSTRRVHLVAQPTANWNVLDVFDGTMSLTHHDFAAKLLRDAFVPRAGLKAGATVAHLSFYLAEFLGCDPIVLIGQDLGFVDGLYYKPGTAIHETWGVELGRFNTLETKEWERIVRSRSILRKIPDINGHPMYTEEQFFVYLQQFERDFAASRCRVIDATEGGARKQGVEVMRLREVIDTILPQAGEERPLAWKTWACDVTGKLKAARGALKARRAEAEAMKEICEQTLPRLKEMIEHQTDAARMNQLFVEVDRLRGKVGNDPATFELVAFLNTIGELRRFHADLRVKGTADGSLERQKRQLMRDKNYVADLQKGAELLIEILNGAMARLDKQLAASEANERWPREVAGAAKAG